ncbi:LANO_0C07800g1_1 [Lachancea nothofagi CBS 11611]|uniref:LANO_0C07800g1_1 n=1 Tax=Lachancea nothofagi CBS 11611 TaxID=1266666 RepID=A0A1G4J8R4_9SACH|nr:LANO_0C07800g1_1 [Lachancea nothofagi CBS 11611]
MPERPSSQTKTRSGSRSNSSSGRRSSLPRVKSSPRLVRTISTDNDSISHGMGHLSLDAGPHESIEVPFVKGTLNASLPYEYLRADVLNLAQALRVHKWYNKKGNATHLTPSHVTLTKITGALTNAIFKVEYSNLPSLLLRVYGPQVDSIIDREYELQVLARLSSHKIGPKLYGCFTNGRFEQFLENSTTLTKNDIRDWRTSQRIARRMKELHSGVPLLSFEIAQGPSAWLRLDKWEKVISNSDWSNDDANIHAVLMCENWEFFLEAVARYRNWLKDSYKDLHHGLVFCHNDAQYGNLLFTSPVAPPAPTPISSAASVETTDSLFPTASNVSLEQIIKPSAQEQMQDSKLVVIDFEYSGANRPAFDLANHFSEWMCDYNCAEAYKSDETRYPSKEELLNFMYSYASHKRGSQKKSIDEEVKELYNDVIRQRACVSLHWATWAIIQSGELDHAKKEKIIEKGPGGEKYVITIDDEDDEEAILDSEENVDGVDIDTFDNLNFAKDKMAVFWGDMLQLGLIKTEELPKSVSIKYLDTKFI